MLPYLKAITPLLTSNNGKNVMFRSHVNIPSVVSFNSARFINSQVKNTPKNDSTYEQDHLYKSIEIEIRSGEPAVLKSYEWFTTFAAKQLNITVGKCWAPPKAHHNRLTLLKSIHIYKKHRVQYEIRTYFRHMTFERLTGSTAATFLEYIQRNVPEGVAVKVTKKSLETLPTPINQISRLTNIK